jgi:class 3 adenylate cyclase
MTAGLLVVTMPGMVKALENDLLPSTTGIALGPERRAITALSVDVVGSMSLCSAMSDERWWLVVEELFTILSDGVMRFGGWIENFAGDGMVAVFGLDGDKRRQAERACAAALWIRDATERYAEELMRLQDVELSVRIGINSGDAVIGALGGTMTPRVVAIGHAVGLAKRIETLAEPGTVAIGHSTATLLTDRHELCELGAFKVRGATQPVELFELVGARAAGASGTQDATPRQLMAVAA